MNNSDTTAFAPLGYVVFEMDDCALVAPGAIRELLALQEAEIVKVIDAIVIQRREDGFETIEIGLLDDDHPLSAFTASLTEILTEEDIRRLADTVSASTCAIVLVLEHTWAAEFNASILAHGAGVATRGPIHRDDVKRSLDASGRRPGFNPRRDGRPEIITELIVRHTSV